MAEPTAREVLAETICIAENKLPLRFLKHEKAREGYREAADILLAALTDAGYSVVPTDTGERISLAEVTGVWLGALRAWPSGHLHIVEGGTAACGRTGQWTSDYPPRVKRCAVCALVEEAPND